MSPTATAFTDFERRAIDACLAGEAPLLAALREQARQATVERREHSGDGARTYLAVPASAGTVEPAALQFVDVDLEVEGVEDGVATSLWVIRGQLAFLEFVAYEGAWPEDPQLRGVRYLQETQIAPGTWSALPVDGRDPATLGRALAGVQAELQGDALDAAPRAAE